MGMFDTIICEYPLPGTNETEFQTKAFENLMFTYIITKEGRLIERSHSLDIVPEEERYYYGKPEWDDNPIFQMMGAMKEVDIKEKDMEFHGLFRMYTMDKSNDNWIEFELKFTNGQLVGIKYLTNGKG